MLGHDGGTMWEEGLVDVVKGMDPEIGSAMLGD